MKFVCVVVWFYHAVTLPVSLAHITSISTLFPDQHVSDSIAHIPTVLAYITDQEIFVTFCLINLVLPKHMGIDFNVIFYWYTQEANNFP